MADVQFNPENKNIDELQGQGLRAYVLQDYETAVKIYSTLSELLVQKHENDQHDSLGDVYLYYGKSLLELARKETDALGEGVLKNIKDSSSEGEGEGGGEEEGADEDEEDGAEGDEKKEEEEEEEATEGGEKKEGGGGGDQPNDTAGPSTSSGKAAEPEEEADEDASDLQLAWEVLELAKKIFEARGEEGTKNLAEALIVLGEISLESGNYDEALTDISAGLEIQKGIFGKDSRTIAETYFKLGSACNISGQHDNSIESYKSCCEHLQNRLDKLKAEEPSKDNEEEIKEIAELIPEIQEKITDLNAFKLEVAKQLAAEAKTSSCDKPNGTASSSKPVSDISHLVKRKRQTDEHVEGPVAKKPTP